MEGIYCLVGRATIPLAVAVEQHYRPNNQTCLGKCEHFRICSRQYIEQMDKPEPDMR